MKLILSLAIATVVSLGFQSNPAPTPAPKFKDVETIFQASCLGCHSGGAARGGIDLNTYDSVMKGGDDGPIIKVGAPKHSVLIQALRGMPGVRKMPRGADPLPEEKIALIENWIKSGAKQ